MPPRRTGVSGSRAVGKRKVSGSGTQHRNVKLKTKASNVRAMFQRNSSSSPLKEVSVPGGAVMETPIRKKGTITVQRKGQASNVTKVSLGASQNNQRKHISLSDRETQPPPDELKSQLEQEHAAEVRDGSPDYESPVLEHQELEINESNMYVPIDVDANDANEDGGNADHEPSGHVNLRESVQQGRETVNHVSHTGELFSPITSSRRATPHPRLRVLTPNTCRRGPSGESSTRFFLENMQKSLLTRLDCVEEILKHVQDDLKTVRNETNQGNAYYKKGVSVGLSTKSKKIGKAATKWAFKDMVDSENGSLKSNVELVFDTSLMSEVLSNVSCYFMKYTWSLGCTLAHTHLAMSAFLYGHQNRCTKKELEAGLARVHCDFKFRFVRTLFVQSRNRFGFGYRAESRDIHAPQGEKAMGSAPSSIGHVETHRQSFSRPQSQPPYWLSPRYVGREAMKKTRELIETKAKPCKEDVDTAKGREGLYIVHTVYAMCTDFLRESRVSAKRRFFEDIGFALRPWETSRGIPASFGQPSVSFKYPEHAFNLDDHIVSATTDEGPNASIMNLRSLRELASSRLELHVLVDHRVLVGEGLLKNGGQKNGFSPAGYKHMYRMINLFSVAVNFFVSFTQSGSVEEFLGSHAESLRTAYRTALLFRWFVQDIINGRCHLAMPSTMANDDNESPVNVPNTGNLDVYQKEPDGEQMQNDDDDERVESILRIEDHDSPGEVGDNEGASGTSNELQGSETSLQGSAMVRLRLRDFLPGISKQKDVLDSQILRMSPSKFSKLCTNAPHSTNQVVEKRNDKDDSARAVNITNESDEEWEDRSDDGFDFSHLLHQT